ncbi:hypothetical protein E2C01_078522 [Portunus trituberculatus]|uniref:Uncharacterized protein n=1 Tax=Portunus trituberculatus TaxID=210409 RepID=A0A5B7IN34_PORTR|nr:hypothetical protein [Portunus trituberculatus]
MLPERFGSIRRKKDEEQTRKDMHRYSRKRKSEQLDEKECEEEKEEEEVTDLTRHDLSRWICVTFRDRPVEPTNSHPPTHQPTNQSTHTHSIACTSFRDLTHDAIPLFFLFEIGKIANKKSKGSGGKLYLHQVRYLTGVVYLHLDSEVGAKEVSRDEERREAGLTR